MTQKRRDDLKVREWGGALEHTSKSTSQRNARGTEGVRTDLVHIDMQYSRKLVITYACLLPYHISETLA